MKVTKYTYNYSKFLTIEDIYFFNSSYEFVTTLEIVLHFTVTLNTTPLGEKRNLLFFILLILKGFANCKGNWLRIAPETRDSYLRQFASMCLTTKK